MIPITDDEKQHPLRYLTREWQTFTNLHDCRKESLRIEVGGALYDAISAGIETMRRLADPPLAPEKPLTFKNSTLHKTGEGWSVTFIRPTE